MAYHKVPLTVRVCACCGNLFEAAHRRRLYCTNSCNTRAYNARKAQQGSSTSDALGNPQTPPSPVTPPTPAAPAASSPQVTLAPNFQNLLMLALAPQVPKAVGAVLQFVGELLAPTDKGPAAALPRALQQQRTPLVPIEHESWEKTRDFVVLTYRGHTLYHRPADRLLLLREASGSWRQLRSQAEVTTLAPRAKPGLQALIAQYAPEAMAPVQAPLLAAPLADLPPYTPAQDTPSVHPRHES